MGSVPFFEEPTMNREDRRWYYKHKSKAKVMGISWSEWNSHEKTEVPYINEDKRRTKRERYVRRMLKKGGAPQEK